MGGSCGIIYFFPVVILAGIFNISWLLSLFATLGVTMALGWLLNLFKGRI
jgi:hypothetical protein